MYKWIEASDYTKDCFKLPAIMEAKYDRHDMTILKGDDVFHPCHGGVVMAGVNTIDEAIQRLDDWYADLPASRK